MQNFDYFAQKPRLLFDRRYSNATLIGAITTILLLVITLLTLSSFSQNFLYKKSPITYSTESSIKENPKFNLNGDEFNMGFYFLANTGEYIMDPSFLTIQASLSTIYLKEDHSMKDDEVDLELEICKDSHFPNDSELRKSFTMLGINYNFCFKKQQKIPTMIAGLWGENLFQRIWIKFRRCVNGTSRLFKKKYTCILKMF
jgi:hypothetical protein